MHTKKGRPPASFFRHLSPTTVRPSTGDLSRYGHEVPSRRSATGTGHPDRSKVFWKGGGTGEGEPFVQADCKLKRNTGLA